VGGGSSRQALISRVVQGTPLTSAPVARFPCVTYTIWWRDSLLCQTTCCALACCSVAIAWASSSFSEASSYLYSASIDDAASDRALKIG